MLLIFHMGFVQEAIRKLGFRLLELSISLCPADSATRKSTSFSDSDTLLLYLNCKAWPLNPFFFGKYIFCVSSQGFCCCPSATTEVGPDLALKCTLFVQQLLTAIIQAKAGYRNFRCPRTSANVTTSKGQPLTPCHHTEVHC